MLKAQLKRPISVYLASGQKEINSMTKMEKYHHEKPEQNYYSFASRYNKENTRPTCYELRPETKEKIIRDSYASIDMFYKLVSESRKKTK